MANEKMLIDLWGVNMDEVDISDCTDIEGILSAVITYLSELPTVDAVEMPKGKPGDYLEWDSGTGFKQIYCICAVMFCEDCVRYDLGKFSPVVDHKNIVRIMTREEAEKEWHERCERERTQEEPTLTAVYGEVRQW